MPTIAEPADATVAGAPEAMNAASEIAAVSLESGISRDEVAELAYSYWVARGCAYGSPDQDWLRAEEEIRRRRQVA